jgi:hypothetical protein
MAYLNHNIPPFTCYIRNEYMFNHKKGHGEFTIADVHTVASMEHRVPLFEALLENGVNWTRRPLHAFCWKKDAPIHSIEMHYYWDCFSPYVDVQVRNRLARRRAELIDVNGGRNWGEYMFTLDWSWENKGVLDTNFAEDPEHKCAHLFMMDDGNYFAYPNNRIVWTDDAYIHNRLTKNPGYEIDLNFYSVENRRTGETNNQYMTEFGKDVGESYDNSLG